MSPDFDDLVGTDLEPGERERLERVHELLIEAGPPPETAALAPMAEIRSRRRGVLLALAAALAVAFFAVGALVGDRLATPDVDFVVPMRATEAAPEASASIAVFEIDEAGNWPVRLTVRGLGPAASGQAYELWLVEEDELSALCGSFRTDEGGSATVPMNAPYKFRDFDGWVVVEEGTEIPLLTT